MSTYKQLHVGLHWGYRFKWRETSSIWDSLFGFDVPCPVYSEKANTLVDLMSSNNIAVGELDEYGNSTVLFVKCSIGEIDGVIEILNGNGFGDWKYYTFTDNNNDFCLYNNPKTLFATGKRIALTIN
jgi:hypothetical protein